MAGEFGMLTANVLMKFKVDSSQARAELKALTGEEKKAAEAALKLQEAKNKQMESWAKGIAKVSAGMMLASKSIALVGDSWKAYEKSALAAGGADAEKAKKFRGALMQMSDSMDKVKIAIGGIVANLAPLVELASQLLSFAAETVGFLGSLPGRAPRQGNAFAGRRGLTSADKRGIYAKTGIEIGHEFGDFGSRALGAVEVSEAMRQTMKEIGGVKADAYLEAIKDVQRQVRMSRVGAKKGGGGFSYGTEGQGIEFLDLSSLTPEARQRRLDEIFAEKAGAYRANQEFSAIGSGGITGITRPEDIKRLFADSQGLTKWASGFEAQVAGQRKASILESVFGKPEEFDLYAEKMQLLSDAMGVVGQAMQSSFDAWISGAATGKQALLDFFKGAITGVASHMFAKAIEHGAMAIGSLAFQDYKGAALHGKAAAAFGVGAVAVGALARAVNGGYDSKSGGGYSAGTAAPSVGGGGGGGQPVTGGNITVYAGDMLALDSQQRQRENFARVYRSARRELAQSTQVRFQ